MKLKRYHRHAAPIICWLECRLQSRGAFWRLLYWYWGIAAMPLSPINFKKFFWKAVHYYLSTLNLPSSAGSSKYNLPRVTWCISVSEKQKFDIDISRNVSARYYESLHIYQAMMSVFIFYKGTQARGRRVLSLNNNYANIFSEYIISNINRASRAISRWQQ